MEREILFPCSIFHNSLVTLCCVLQYRLFAKTTLLIFAVTSFWIHALSSRTNFHTALRTEFPPQVLFNSGNTCGSKTQPISRHLIHLQLTRVLPNPILIYDPWDSQKSACSVTGFVVNANLCCVCLCLVVRLCVTLCDRMDYNPPGPSIHGIFQARILEWVAISFSIGSSRPRDQTCLSFMSCIDRCFTTLPRGKPQMFTYCELI